MRKLLEGRASSHGKHWAMKPLQSTGLQPKQGTFFNSDQESLAMSFERFQNC